MGREEPSVADFRPSQGPEQNPICFLHGHKVNWPKAKRGWPGPCAGQKTLLTPRVPASLARFGVHPPILGAQRSGSQNSCLSQPAQLGGGPLRAWDTWAAGQAEKREDPTGSPKLEKVGPGRKNLFLPGVLSSGFLPKKAGPPPGAGRATGRCAPRAASEPPTRRVRSPAPAGQGPHQTGPLFFCAILCNFFAPTVYAGVQLWPRFPRG